MSIDSLIDACIESNDMTQSPTCSIAMCPSLRVEIGNVVADVTVQASLHRNFMSVAFLAFANHLADGEFFSIVDYLYK